MYQHHLDSIEKMKEYFFGREGVIALVLGGSVAKGNERPDSDIDGMVNSGYDLSLFTCNYGGKARVTVRCDRVEAVE